MNVYIHIIYNNAFYTYFCNLSTWQAPLPATHNKQTICYSIMISKPSVCLP